MLNRVILAAFLGLGLIGSANAASGNKPSVGVAEFRNESGAAWWRGGVGWELSGLLSNELAATGKFRVVERSKLEAVLAEQNMAATGRVKNGPRIGQLSGAQYLVMGTVTSYEENTKSTGGGISFGGISVGGNSQKAYLAIDIRVVNTTTGELDFVRTVEGLAKGGGMSLGLYRGGWGANLDNQKNTPAGKAIRAAVIEVTDYLECVMVKQNGCVDEYDAKESRRREKTKGALDLDD